jgi:nitrate/nitrite-specific signal transduction histidine kinase
MKVEDVEKETEKLKMKMRELSTRYNLTNDFDTKEKLEGEMRAVGQQIKVLERLL